MRNKLVKKLRKEVMIKLYVGDDVTEKDIRKGKHDVMDSMDFKRVFRARKKNHVKDKRSQNPKSVPDKPGAKRYPINRQVKKRW